MKSLSKWMSAAGVVALLAACGPKVETIELNPANVSLSKAGETAAVAARALDKSGAEVAGATVAWTSSDPAVVEVDQTGKVTAKKSGSATLTAAVAGAPSTGSATVKVSIPSSLTLSPEKVDVATGATAMLSATVKDDAGAAVKGAATTWSSADSAIATVSPMGEVTGVAAGTTEVVAKASGLEAKVAVTVTQAAAEAPAKK